MTAVEVDRDGGQQITASITKDVAEDLGLAVGTRVPAVVKSTEVMLGTYWPGASMTATDIAGTRAVFGPRRGRLGRPLPSDPPGALRRLSSNSPHPLAALSWTPPAAPAGRCPRYTPGSAPAGPSLVSTSPSRCSPRPPAGAGPHGQSAAR
jgi:TOBE domain